MNDAPNRSSFFIIFYKFSKCIFLPLIAPRGMVDFAEQLSKPSRCLLTEIAVFGFTRCVFVTVRASHLEWTFICSFFPCF